MKSEDPAKMTYSKTDFLGRGREKSTAFLEISRKFEGLGLELVSRNLTLVQQKATPGPRHVVLELPFVGGARTEGGRWTIYTSLYSVGCSVGVSGEGGTMRDAAYVRIAWGSHDMTSHDMI